MPVASPETFASTLGGTQAAAQQRIAITVERQEQDNWCWSAVSVSIERFYDVTCTRTQCQLAGAALQRTDCCGDGADDPDKCDQPWYLDRALAITGNLEDMKSGTPGFADVQSRVGAGSPMGCRIGWYGGGGHFVVIRGWAIGSNGERYLDLFDPISLDSTVALDAFPSSYKSGGDWTHTYLTAPAPSGGNVMVASTSPDPDTMGA